MRRYVVLLLVAVVAFAGVVTVNRAGVPRYVETGAEFLPPAGGAARLTPDALRRNYDSGVERDAYGVGRRSFPVDSFASPDTTPFGLAYDGANLWNVDLFAEQIHALDPATGSVRRSFGAPDQYSKGLCWDGHYLWVTGNNAGRIFKVDTTSGSVVLSFAAPGVNPVGLAFDGTYLWCADVNADQSRPSHIFKLNPANGARLDSFDAPCRMVADMDWDGSRLWVNDMDNGIAYGLDPSTGAVVKATGTPGPEPTGLAFEGSRIVVSDWARKRVYTFSPDSGPAAITLDKPAQWDVIPTWRDPAVIGTVCGLGLDSFRVEYGTGANPSQWTPVAPARAEPVYKDTLAAWDVSGITQPGEYSLRVKALFGSQVDTAHVVSIGIDPQIARGWPYTHANISPVACANITGSDTWEVVAGLDHQNSLSNTLGGWRLDGSTLPGFPVAGIGVSHSRPAAGDVDHDGLAEIATGFDYNRQDVYLVRGNGQIMTGWPQDGGHPGTLMYLGVPALADVDSDTMLEVFSGGGHLSGWDESGAPLSGWPKSAEYSSPAVVDFSIGGEPELVAQRKDSLYAFDADGGIREGWPVGYSGTGGSTFPVAGDINNDGRKEIVFTIGTKLCCVNDSGRMMTGFPKTLAGSSANSPVLGDIDRDGLAEIVVVSGTFPNNSVVQVYRYDGSAVTGWPKTLNGLVFRTFNAPVIADVDDDGYPEILMGFEPNTDNFCPLYAWKRDGTVLEGWPKLLRCISGYGITGSPVLADMNGDGLLECALSNNAYWVYSTDIYVWNLGVPCHPDRMDWPMLRHDPQMTACWKPAAAGIEDSPKPQASSPKLEVTIVRGVLYLGVGSRHYSACRAELLDAAGRKVLDLRPGANDVSHLAPGVYFVRAVSRELSAASCRKVVVQR